MHRIDLVRIVNFTLPVRIDLVKARLPLFPAVSHSEMFFRRNGFGLFVLLDPIDLSRDWPFTCCGKLLADNALWRIRHDAC